MEKRFFIAIIASAASLLAISGCRQESNVDASQEAPSVEVARVERGTVTKELHVAGMFQPYQEVEVHAKVAGYIRHINVDIGDRVRAGQVLATLEIPEMDAELKGSDAEVRHSKDEITRAEDQVAFAESQRAAVHSAYVRLQQASKAQPGMIAEQELDDALARDQSTEAQINVAKAALSAARQQSDVSAASRMHVGAMADYASITAPLSGVITWRYADTGALIQAGTASSTQALPVVKLEQTDILRLRFPVPESDVALVHEGQDVKVEVQATHQSFHGQVTRFTRSLDLSTRTMEVEVDVKNHDLSLSPGMYADTTLQLQRKDNALAISPNALIREGQKTSVMVVGSDNRISVRPVSTGIEEADKVEIVSGLAAGDLVVTAGQANYHTGEQVRPKIERPSAAQSGEAN
jgi:RND family efflux transporter MFP subunit